MNDKKTETWYVTEQYREEIRAVEVVSTTEKTVTLVGGRKQYKDSTYDKYHPTWRAARQHKLDRVNAHIDRYKADLAKAEEAKERIEAMVDPTVSAQP